jgi:hypothetical protein
MLQAIEDPAIGHPREPLGGHRGPSDVSVQPLEALAVARGDGDVRVEAHAAGAGAALPVEFGHRVRIDAVSHANHGPARAAPRGDAARHRRAVELGEQGLVLR